MHFVYYSTTSARTLEIRTALPVCSSSGIVISDSPFARTIYAHLKTGSCPLEEYYSTNKKKKRLNDVRGNSLSFASLRQAQPLATLSLRETVV
jgi:hypothetical protein